MELNRTKDAREDLEKENKADIEQLLMSGQAVQIKPQGYSMYPMFVPGRDEAIIEPIADRTLKRGDIALYRRGMNVSDSKLQAGILVLHRICRKNKHGIYMAGDNQSELEGPLEEAQMRGVLTAFIRKGNYFSVKNPCYQVYVKVWLLFRPCRIPFMRFVAALKRKLKGLKS